MKAYDWKLEHGPSRGDDGTRTVAVFHDDSERRVEVSLLTNELSDFGEADTAEAKEDRALTTLRLMLDQYGAANEIQPGQLTRVNENDVDLLTIKRASKGNGEAGRAGTDK
jgi:hypothetical protein